MSLKAKIEAVIYAAEEPVTLAQLTILFAEEALEEKKTREAAERAAKAATDAAAESAAPTPDDGVIPEQTELIVEEEIVILEEPAEEAPVEAATSESPAEPSAEDEKRAARLRDRAIRDELRRLLDELIGDYTQSDRGMEVREIAGGYRIGTKPEYHDAVRGFVKSLKPPMKLSLPALEALAVIAYKQPVTAPEVGEIRGVESAGVIGSLVSRKLVTTAGRKQVIGRPILYKTTKEFLLRFGLKDISELPSMEEFEKMAAAELSEPGDLPFESQPDTVLEMDRETILEDMEPEEIENAKAVVRISDESEDDADLPGIAAHVESGEIVALEQPEPAQPEPVQQESAEPEPEPTHE